MTRLVRSIALLGCCVGLTLLAACAAPAGGAASWSTRLLAAAGLGPAPQPVPPEAVVELHASAVLNAGADGVPVPAVVQLRWLEDPAAFQRAGYERLAAGGDGVREIVLAPGRTLTLRERPPAGTRALGLAVLFRAPASGRWKLMFPLPAAQPIRVSLHRCALALASGAAWDAPPGADRLGDLRCPSSD
ncbi:MULTISPECIES: type VI secretion system lipoprotein TssJ [unclassified Rubrivivax]|uniref:type VI secretion system lipoprotein TssJ n=1 Tax=unclassified Rubrivivax TaxID=2649762 RepID=UPI001E2EA41E|nr:MULTISPECIES: type VI secretion system lipoprotein TssJ [unclassified Rubrivivax]MCC9597799.1 type VI secretion system lipoprotein TssJ [Rubrivivax sp. JA1055]MCC9645944.1 type VI secretion system lipoprotein TssJ [Rubrivivax sp. JA1029]